MKGLSIQLLTLLTGGLLKPGRFSFEPAAIDTIAEQWVSDMSHMDADLVGPPGFQATADQTGMVGIVFEAPPMGGGGAPGTDHGHFCAVVGMAPHRCCNKSFRWFGFAPYHGQIFALQGPAAPVIGKQRL